MDGVLSSLVTALVTATVGCAFFLVVRSGGLPVPERLQAPPHHWPEKMQVPGVGALMAIDKGTLKVLVVTLQIISSIAGNLDATLPEPFGGWLEAFSFVSINFISTDCAKGQNFHDEVNAACAKRTRARHCWAE